MLTLSAVRASLWKYASNVAYSGASSDDKAAFDAVLNQVCERFLNAGYSDTQLASLTAYPDARGHAFVTLPRELKSLIGIVEQTDDCTGPPLSVRGNWYEFLPSSGRLCPCAGGNAIALPGKFVTFRDWTDPSHLRFKFETNETTGVIHLTGKLNSADVFSRYSSSWIKGEKVAFTASTAVTVAGGTQDGNYADLGTFNGKRYYNLNGIADAQAGGSINWDDGRSNAWAILDDAAGLLYYSDSAVATPDLASNWKNGSDDSAASITVLLGVASATSSSKFDAVGLSAVKPSTNGRVSVFAVDDDDVETLVGLWEPAETVPRYRRYKVPTGETDSVTGSVGTCTAICKREFIPLVLDDEEVLFSLGTLKLGLMASNFEDKNDGERAALFWGPNFPERTGKMAGALDLLDTERAETQIAEVPGFASNGFGAGGIAHVR